MNYNHLNREHLYYLCSPYSTPKVDTGLNGYREQVYMRVGDSVESFLKRNRYQMIDEVGSILCREGINCIEPIAMCHPKSQKFNLPQEFAYWEKRDKLFIDRCDALLVAGFDGWTGSTGVVAEIHHAFKTFKPVHILKIDFNTPEVITGMYELKNTEQLHKIRMGLG